VPMAAPSGGQPVDRRLWTVQHEGVMGQQLGPALRNRNAHGLVMRKVSGSNPEGGSVKAQVGCPLTWLFCRSVTSKSIGHWAGIPVKLPLVAERWPNVQEACIGGSQPRVCRDRELNARASRYAAVQEAQGGQSEGSMRTPALTSSTTDAGSTIPG
jgi:hypothetical protein